MKWARQRKRLDYRQHFEFLMRIRRYWNWVNILCLLTAWIDLWPRGCCISARWFTEGHQSQRQGYISINSVYISFIFPVANWFRFLSARFCHFYRSAVFYQLGFFSRIFQHHFTVRFIVVFAESFSTFCRHFLRRFFISICRKLWSMASNQLANFAVIFVQSSDISVCFSLVFVLVLVFRVIWPKNFRWNIF